MKVLIAEDDSTSAIVLRKALEKLGHEAIVATDGDQAYKLLSQDTQFVYRVVISDWMMPGMDGLELTRKLRAEREVGDPCRFVILLTARGRPEDRRMGLEAGADDFMVKPLDMGDLIPRLSIAERMLRLEDALAESQNAPFYGGATATTALPTPDVAALEAAAQEALGEEAANQILLGAVRDYDAQEVHFEPHVVGKYRIRGRVSDGSLTTLPTAETVPAAVKYLVMQAKDGATIHDGGVSRSAKIAVLPTPHGDRLCVSFVPDPLAQPSLMLDDLPMSGDVRYSLRTLLQGAKQSGGVLFVAGARRDAPLIYQTLTAFRNEVTDGNTIVLDDLHAKRSDRLLAQRPDVLIGYGLDTDANGPTYITAGRQHGVLLIAATYENNVAVPTKLYPTHLGTLTIRFKTDANSGDRYELKIPTESEGLLDDSQEK